MEATWESQGCLRGESSVIWRRGALLDGAALGLGRLSEETDLNEKRE